MSKKNIIFIIISAVLILAIGGISYWSYREQLNYESKLAELSDANSRLREQLTKADYQLSELQDQHKRVDELVRSSGSIIGELRESMESNATTIKAIREQQQQLRTAVVRLIEDYNRLAAELDGSTD